MSALAHHFEEGGFGMYPILFWQILAIGIIVERAIYLYKASINREVFLATMQKCILAGDIGRAIKLCSAANAPLARIVKAGLMKVNRPDAEVQSAMDEAALVELPKIEHRTPLLALFANLAMLCGLFGTVAGLIVAFGAVANADAASKATMLAKGISEAMNCTAFGLMTAVPILLAHAFLQTKTSELVASLEMAFVKFLNVATERQVAHSRRGALQAAPAAGG